MAISPFAAAINQLADERGLPKEVILETIEAAVAAAYRKDYGQNDEQIIAKLDEESGSFLMWQTFEVVAEPENIQAQLTPADAKKYKKNAKIGDVIKIELEPHSDFGRIAAQTAKQVISQRLREAEKEILYAEYKDKQGQLINGYVQQVEGPNVILNIGKLNGLMIASDQIPNQNYFPGQRLKVLVYSVEETPRGPRVLVTRSSTDFIQKLFDLEVPEMANGTVTIKAISREAGTRTKMAVTSTMPGLDPVGSCVGQRGTRVQAVLSEIGEEKIDIISWNDTIEQLLANALSPAKIEKITLQKKRNVASVKVPDDQLSLAIGKNGQNVRLASKLTGWEIDIVKDDGSKPARDPRDADSNTVTAPTKDDSVADAKPGTDGKKVTKAKISKPKTSAAKKKPSAKTKKTKK
ncbi:transcription termination factor NusA [Candidatus Berkelbacteria bacterium RIFCSPLOWO2_01_FULL_50_28]|uniref:Transcription termination/antitermination protein NusA n=1 Tax=Candidatus Berkelbacteria bacterium RIFCSPLOWO2_01_FULL_50_28 TaxID=1797471 RepID=A0A1F5EBS3_9BACT|nr:MAG: transcription termination factor NusA [Candidatus Berkelbacteria bacterium RIFCSPHIGHO2_01_FULL_50_36]OGD62220.1 MAG: transcription termination factor NusA [Candidatus Berkelbacteria bacterium RIFCSPHIGHO2_12_FULL_50_11]OGD64862.1 MAG: transcription termination factor NusA [Candidatus Berkelbacteria bacterium RIFCSPLOWO2_01_FULL_50_28]